MISVERALSTWVRITLAKLLMLKMTRSDSISSRLSNCGVSHGCWLMPPGCEQTSGPICSGVVTWTVNAEGIVFTLITYTADLYEIKPASKALYGAIGFSLDSFMGEDLIFVCAMDGINGQSKVYLAWNNQQTPERLYSTTNAIVSESQLSIVDNRMNCQFKWSFTGQKHVPTKFASKMYNLSDPTKELYLFFVRGHADVNTLDLQPHSVADGLLFPYISGETVTFCESGCGQMAGMPWITQMHQAQISQTLKQGIVIGHATLMLTISFVFFPTAIMSARFNKDYLHRFCGVYMWFHIHWICNLFSFAGVSVAFFAIYYQNHFKLPWCSQNCNNNSHNRQLHAVFGTATYSFMCSQVLTGLCRPKIISASRSSFNFVHTFMGYLIWILCCRSALLGTQMQKTGLVEFFGYYPEHMIWLSICSCLICFVVCEWIVHRDRNYMAQNPDGIEMLNTSSALSETKLVGTQETVESPTFVPLIIMCFNAVVGLCITATIVIMMLRAAQARGFKL